MEFTSATPEASQRQPRIKPAVLSADNQPTTNAPQGRYVVAFPGTPDSPRLVHVTKPDSGQWAGRTFVWTAPLADEPNERILGADAIQSLNLIEADPRGCAEAFGRITGRCGQCNRLLGGDSILGMHDHCSLAFFNLPTGSGTPSPAAGPHSRVTAPRSRPVTPAAVAQNLPPLVPYSEFNNVLVSHHTEQLSFGRTRVHTRYTHTKPPVSFRFRGYLGPLTLRIAVPLFVVGLLIGIMMAPMTSYNFDAGAFKPVLTGLTAAVPFGGFGQMVALVMASLWYSWDSSQRQRWADHREAGWTLKQCRAAWEEDRAKAYAKLQADYAANDALIARDHADRIAAIPAPPVAR